MATSSGTAQRAWRANCPGCGAPIEFRSAASTHAVCAYCATTVVRDGETLKSLGKISALFQDFSPLQLGSTGQRDGRPFTVVGRLQYGWAQGMWNEWWCLSDALDPQGGLAGGWLSEDNGQFVWSEPAPASMQPPPLQGLRLNQDVTIGGLGFAVSAITEARLIGGEGELPRIAPLNKPFTVVELRNAQGQVLSLDDMAPDAPGVYLGQAVRLDALQLRNLRSESSSDIKGGRQFACPQCGHSISIQLEQTRSLACPACHALIDTSAGIGQEVVSALQTDPIVPAIALGTSGKLRGTDWQVVGYSTMLGKESPQSDESFGWEEYLLFNRMEGFSFLAESSEGWSLSKPLSGSATMSGNKAKYLGATYTLKESYSAEVSYVAGEFYWQVRRGAKVAVMEFAGPKAQLIREQAASEVTWSRSEAVQAMEVIQAFGAGTQRVIASDIKPTTSSSTPLSTIIILVVFFMVLAIVLATCSRSSDCDPNTQNCAASSGSGGSGVRGWGGSYGGGSSSGGGHK